MSIWTLYGQKLDLERFLKFHPGGDIALLLGADKDCTLLFEQYHIRNDYHIGKLQAFVDLQGNPPDSNPLAIPEPDPFQRDLLAAVRKMGKYNTSPAMIVAVILFGLGTGAAWWGWMNGSWLALLVLPFIKWLFVVNTFHDASHFAFSRVPLINEIVSLTPSPLYFNTAYWYLQHDVSHHTQTNTPDHDIDLYHGSPWVRFHWSDRWQTIHSFQVGIIAMMNFLWSTIAESMLYPVLLLCGGEMQTKFLGSNGLFLKRMRLGMILQLGLCAAYLIYPWFAFGIGWKAAVFVFYPYFVASMIFMTITQISHIQSTTQGVDTLNVNKPGRWMRQMVETSLDYSQDSVVWTFLTGALNMQSLHHCLPVLSSSRYRAFYPEFRAICRQHGVQIRETDGIWSAIKSYWNYIHQLSQPKIE